jgi:hypothetical protein
MSFANVVDGGCGTNGVKRVMTSASLSFRRRLRMLSGHRRSFALPAEDVSWCGIEVVLDRVDFEVWEEVLFLCSPILMMDLLGLTLQKRQRAFCGFKVHEDGAIAAWTFTGEMVAKRPSC